MTRATRDGIRRLRQGDVIRNVDYIEGVSEKDGIIEVVSIRFPLVIVLTQDCDLQQDYTTRIKDSSTQELISVLAAPLYNAEHVFQGEHLSRLEVPCPKIIREKTEGKYLVTNQRPRYHYIDFPEGLGLVPSVIDFRHYFSVEAQYLQKLKRDNYVCTVSELHREKICQRFAAFLSRIGLPSAVLEGPFALTIAEIDAFVAKEGPGHYILGKTTPRGTFVPEYVGYSSMDVNRELKSWASNSGLYTRFKYSYAPTAKAAFDMACSDYHDFVDNGLNNKVHPPSPAVGSGMRCSLCTALC